MPIKILVVDDEKDIQHLIPQEFKSEIRLEEYEFQFANSGKKALEKLEENESFDLILLDINMPEMDGLTLMEKLNEFDIYLHKTIIISGLGDMKNIRASMNRGAFDFVSKPIDFQDLKITINRCLNEHSELDSLKKEIIEAGKLLPKMLLTDYPAFPGRDEFDLHAQMIPAKKIGGDFYDYFFLDEHRHRLGIVVGDIAGKGVRAALLMLFTKNLTNITALKCQHTDTCLESLNEELIRLSSGNIQGTILYGILDTRNGNFDYCSGGHLPPILISTVGEVTLLENKGGTPIGMLENSDYESNRIILKHGDILFVYTDGVTDAGEEGNEEEIGFGKERLMNCLQNIQNFTMKEITDRVIAEVKTFSQGKKWDDITCLALKYKGKP